MDRESICNVLEEIGAENIKPYKKNVQCSCFLADWREGHSTYSDHSGSMGISVSDTDYSKAHCFSCGFRGTFIKAVSELSRLSGADYSMLIKNMATFDVPDLEAMVSDISSYDQDREPDQDVIFDEKKLDPFRGRTHKYLLNRGIELQTIKHLEGGYDQKLNRVVFPVRRKDNCLVGATGRLAYDPPKDSGMKKSWNYFGYKSGNFLLGENQVKGNSCIVVEGLLDFLSVWQSLSKSNLLNDYSVLGLLGSKATEVQIKKLLSFSDEIISFHDNDPAGWTGKLDLAKRIKNKRVLKYVSYPKPIGGDPSKLFMEGYDLVERIVSANLLLT